MLRKITFKFRSKVQISNLHFFDERKMAFSAAKSIGTFPVSCN